MSTSSPEWFDWAVAQPRSSHFTEVSGTRIHYASWNAADTHKPALLFAHGFLGHSHWWDFIAPFFTERFRVFALDFAGMGQSAHRALYTAESFVADMAAVLGAIRLPGSEACTVIGHSFGGSRTLQASAQAPEHIGRAIVLDSFVLFCGEERPSHPYRPAPRPYPDEATAHARFRLLPDQVCEAYLLQHVRQHSLRRVDEGWTWCFDPALRELHRPPNDADLLGRIDVPVDYVHAEASSVVSAERALRIAKALPHGRGPVTMPRAHHHMMLDQPLALIGVLRALLA